MVLCLLLMAGTIYAYLRRSGSMASTIYAYLRRSGSMACTIYAYLRRSGSMACTIYAYLRRSGAGPGAFGCLGEGPGFPLGPPWVQTALKISNRKQANRVGGVAKCMKNVVREFSFL